MDFHWGVQTSLQGFHRPKWAQAEPGGEISSLRPTPFRSPIMFRGNYDNNKPPEPITETETERAERLRLEQVMRDRIEDSRKRKQEEDANRRMFSQPGALLPKASEEPSSQPQQAPTSYRSTQRPSQFKSRYELLPI